MMRRGRRRAEKRTKGRRDAGKAARPGGPTTPGPGQPPGARALGDLLAASMAPVAQGVEVGELFAYEAKAPVTIRRGQAALVPILFETLREGKRVLYWRGDLSQHPSHAFRLENSTRLTLEKGPVTVFEASACLGEGMLRKTLRPGMHVILPYALETGVEVEPRPRLAQRPVSRAVLANGILTLYRKAIRETRYEVRNKTGEAWTLYLDHPKAGGGFRLVAPAKAAEELAAHQRFLVEVPAQGKTALAVREEREVGIQVQVRNQRTEQIGLYLKQGYLSDPARSFLAGIVKLMDERTALDREIAAGKDELQRLNRNQDRLRRDLGVLRTTPREQVLRDKYLDKLLQGSDRIEELNRKTTEASRRRRALDERIARDLGSFRE